MTMLLKDHCAKVSASVSASTGIAESIILPIIQILLPMIMQMPCLQSAPSLKEKALDSYDPNTDQFDSHAVKRVRPLTRRAARKAGHPAMSVQDLDAMTVAAFRQALDSPEQDIASAKAEAALIPNVEVIDG